MPEKPHDPYGSITIAPDREKPAAGPGDIPVTGAPQRPSRQPKTRRAADAPQSAKAAGGSQQSRPGRPFRTFALLILPGLIGLALLAYTAIGFFGVPYLLQSVAPARMAQRINRSIAFGDVRFNPFTLRLQIRHAIIGPDRSKPDDPVDPLFSAGLIEADLAWSSLIQQQFNCKKLLLDNLFLHLVRDERKTYNISALLPIEADQGSLPVIDLPFTYLVKNITVANSRIVFDDLPAHKTHTIEQIELALPLLFHYPDGRKAAADTLSGGGKYVNPRFSALVNGSPLELTGKTRVEGDTFTAQLQLHLDRVDLPAYLAYLPEQPPWRLEKGLGDILMDITFLSGPGDQLGLEIETAGRLTEVALLDQGNGLNLVPEATIRATLYPLLGRYTIKEINLANPHLRLTRRTDGSWSFPALLGPRGAPDSKKVKSEQEPEGVTIEHGKITNGTISFDDRKVAGGFAEELAEIDFTLADFNQASDQPAPFSLNGVTADHTRFAASGEIVPSSLLVRGQLSCGPLNLPRLANYLAGQELRVSQGKIDRFSSRFTLHDDQSRSLDFHDGELAVSNLTISGRQGQLLAAPSMRLSYSALDPGAGRLEKVALTADRAELFLAWNRQNQCNWQLPFAPAASAKEKAWQVTLASMELPEAMVHLEDHSLPTPMTLAAKAQIKATDLTTSPDHQGELVISTDELGGGTLSLSGPVGLSPFRAQFTCTLTNYQLVTLPSLVTDWLGVGANLSGTLDAQGELTLPHFAYTGAVTIHNFSAGREKEAEIRFATAAADQLDFSLQPLSMKTAELSLDQAYLRWVIPAKGPMNVESFFSRKSPGLTGFINRGQLSFAAVKLSEATLDFTDQRVSPAYGMQLTLDGTVSNLINEPGKRAQLALNWTAPHDETGTVSGDLGFFDPAFSADLEAKLDHMRAADFSPALSQVLGYTLRDGRFELNTSYHQQNGQVTAENTLTISGLQLGEQRVPNSQLPLTVALLTDQKGLITLALPVRGALDDPAYSFAGTSSRALRSIALKTAVSPFSQLQTAFPELEHARDYLLFAPGSAALTPDHKNFLALLAQAINQRPLLNLIIKGYADAGRDRETLLAQKREMARQQELEAEQKQSAQMAEKYGKEEIAADQQNQPPPAPMSVPPPVEISVSKNELLELARERQKAVADYLASTLKVDAKRLLGDSAAALVPANAAGRPGARVDLQFGAATGRK